MEEGTLWFPVWIFSMNQIQINFPCAQFCDLILVQDCSASITLQIYYITLVFFNLLIPTQSHQSTRNNQSTKLQPFMQTLNFHILYSDLNVFSLSSGSVLCKKLPWNSTGRDPMTLLPPLLAAKKHVLPCSFLSSAKGEELTATIETPYVFHNTATFYLVGLLWQRGTNPTGLLGLEYFEGAIWWEDQTWRGRGTITGCHGGRRE